jgi:ATP-dependent Clp protease ATP-binding subunit ClpC
MAGAICDFCGIRPVMVQAEVVSNGRQENLELCNVNFRRLAHEQGRLNSPLESTRSAGLKSGPSSSCSRNG